MATRKEILKDLRETTGNAMCESAVAKYLGKSRTIISRELTGDNVPYVRLDGKKKTYLAIDIARWIELRQGA
jgi:hypothetical protein